MTANESREDRQELLTLWRLRTPGAEIHIEERPTRTGVVLLCEEEISSRGAALTSCQPEARVRNPYAPMCAGCLAALDQIRKTNQT
jgi:hypothetical protein